jgi:cell volume regulation protein A
MTELHDFALILLVVAGGLSLALVATRVSDIVPVPAPLLFLVASALASDASSDLRDALSIRDVQRIAVVALVVILFNGGLDIGWRRMRASAGSVLSLGVLGTFATAGVVALAAHLLLGFGWTLAGILGAALAPTDPAVMFSVLGGRELRGRSGTMLEGEAGFNDPAGIALMVGMIELATHTDATFWVVVKDFAREMVIGAALGVAGARVLIAGLHRVRLGSEPLYPVLVLMLAAVLYGVTGVVGGSGFLAVFVAGLLVADAPDVPQREAIASIAGLGEVVVFVGLGLTIGITHIAGRTWLDGVVLVAVLALVARPAAVALTLARARLSRNERAFIAWSGLKGAVPILLAAFAILGGVPGAARLYGIVFVVVALSVLVQGSLVGAVASRLDVAAER